jgi:hypothetical protein
LNIKHLLDTIDEVSSKIYPEMPEISNLCKVLIMWERDYASLKTPRYKEPYQTFLKGVEKRWAERIAKESREE